MAALNLGNLRNLQACVPGRKHFDMVLNDIKLVGGGFDLDGPAYQQRKHQHARPGARAISAKW